MVRYDTCSMDREHDVHGEEDQPMELPSVSRDTRGWEVSRQ